MANIFFKEPPLLFHRVAVIWNKDTEIKPQHYITAAREQTNITARFLTYTSVLYNRTRPACRCRFVSSNITTSTTIYSTRLFPFSFISSLASATPHLHCFPALIGSCFRRTEGQVNFYPSIHFSLAPCNCSCQMFVFYGTKLIKTGYCRGRALIRRIDWS